MLWTGKLSLELSICLQGCLIPAHCGSQVLHSLSPLDNPKPKQSQVEGGSYPSMLDSQVYTAYFSCTGG